MKDVLVVQLARFGDILQTKRLMLSLAKENVRVHLCVDDALADIASLVYPFATIHTIPAHAIAKEGKEALDRATRVLIKTEKSIATLRSINFSRVYTLNASSLSYAIARLFPAEIVHGYKVQTGQDKRDLWCQIASRLIRFRETTPLNLVDYWGLFHDNPINPSQVNPSPKPAGSGRIGVVMAGRASRRSLPPDVLAKYIEAYSVKEKSPTVVFFGGKTEQHLARKLIKSLPSRLIGKIEDLTGKTALSDLPEVLLGLDCLLTPDTGIMHLAAHIGTPIHAFFLSSAWCFETGPYGAGHHVWQASIDCAPCIESSQCLRDVECLAPFYDDNLFRHIAASSEKHWPKNINAFVSEFDELGVIYRLEKGNDPYTIKRLMNRKVLFEWIQSQKAHLHDKIPLQMDQESSDYRFALETIYTERDWMLPIDTYIY